MRRVISNQSTKWMLQRLETIEGGVETACSCNGHLLGLWFLSVTRIYSECVTIVRDSGLGMGISWYSRPLRGVEVLAMPDMGLDATRWVESVCEVPPRAGVLRRLIPGVEVAVVIDLHCVADRVAVMR
jgi:hypothetical protein